MVKRNRDEAGALHAPQQAKPENPSKSPPPKRCWDPAVGGAAGKARGPVERGRTEPEAKRVAGDSISRQVVTGDAPETHAEWGAGSAATELPRWRQLWLGRGGGMVVDFEELLWGWFPFTDEDFSSDGEKVGWLSIWEDEVEGQQQGVLYDDIWQLKHINEIPSRSR